MKKSCLRLIGDVHGNISKYISLAEEVDFSIQLGDMGFDYTEISQKLSPNFHKILAGNHDNYTRSGEKFVNQTPHFLGNYGNLKTSFGDFFFVRGGFSIDYKSRTPGVDWWSDEEISQQQANCCLELYEETKPYFVISHECPESIIKYVSTFSEFNGEIIKPSFTSLLLQKLFDIHQPAVWFFGHHHRSWIKVINETEFNCLNELEFCDIYVWS